MRYHHLPNLRQWLTKRIRLVLGTVFVLAALQKLWSPSAANGATLYGEAARLVPYGDLILPGCELALGAWLMSGFAVQAAALVSSVVLLSFSGVLVSTIIGDTPRACGCFGAAYGTIDLKHQLFYSLVINLALLLGAAACFILLLKRAERGRSAQSPEEVGLQSL